MRERTRNEENLALVLKIKNERMKYDAYTTHRRRSTVMYNINFFVIVINRLDLDFDV